MQNLRHSTSQDESKKAKRQAQINRKYADFVDYCTQQITKVENQIKYINQHNLLPPELNTAEIQLYVEYAKLFQDQIIRRVFNGEKIPHEEKMFSVFEPHTEWIVKGKAGVRQELGLRVCVVTDSTGFTLHHKVMQRKNDSDVAVEVIGAALEKFPNIGSCSFDKGFWSPRNKLELETMLDTVALPKKGRLSKVDKEHQHSKAFMAANKGHSAVESAINAHENHGLDKCPDKGIAGYKKYVSLSVLGRNIQHLGALLIKQEKEAEKRSEAIKRGLALKRTA